MVKKGGHKCSDIFENLIVASSISLFMLQVKFPDPDRIFKSFLLQ